MDAADERYRNVSEYYRRAREGHVYIAETLEAFFDVLGARLAPIAEPAILELGSHAGILTQSMLERWPQSSVLVSDDDESLIDMSRRRLQNKNVAYCSERLDDITQTIDVVVSVARHHHLAHDYLGGVRHVVGNRAVYVLADELCPEYCYGEHAERIARAEVIHIVGGYVLTSLDEVRELREHGAIPAAAVAMEELRRRALWRWYRFVVDEAVERGYFDIAVGELQSTHDDLITGSHAEHKFCSSILERQFALAGFELLSKRLIGPATDPARQSMFVYEFGPAPS
jgi:hypothetical protein